MRKVRLAEGEYYHIYNRGVEKCNVFIDDSDYNRFLFLLAACNDTSPLLNSQFHYRGLASIASIQNRKKRDKLVDIICFCLMSNHFHLLLKQRKDRSISLFMQKLGTGYTMYFNTKRERSGSLFQGTFKAVHIDKQNYLNQLVTYIHLNPIDLVEPKWKENGIQNWQSSYDFARGYRWSSYRDFLRDGSRFKNILSLDIVFELFGSVSTDEKMAKKFVKGVAGYLSDYTIEAKPL